MYKFLTSFVLVLILGWQSALAAAPLPTKTISVEPLVAEDGSPIKISALIYNSQKETVTFAIEFKAGEISLGKPIVTIAALGAKTVAVDWKQPKIKTDVSATIVSALDKQKKDIVSLHGVVGTIVLGTEDIKTPSGVSFGQGKAGAVFSGLFSKVEVFRQKEAIYFATLRDESKQKLGIQIKDDVIKKLSPLLSPPTTAPTIGTEELAITKDDNPLKIYKTGESKYYVTLILGTVMASFFASAILFYIIGIIVLLFLIRLVFKMFS